MSERNLIITLTTDFGEKDPYVAEIKAVILNISPNTAMVDITHQVEKFDLRSAGYILYAASSYFPEDTIHVVVVDPGVGTERRAILVQTEKCQFIGPDNGVLALASENQGIKQIYSIENSNFMRSEVSHTFHGRDIFAPAAAHLANGVPPYKFGPELNRMKMPKFAKTIKSKNKMIGTVLYVDSFGNIITNLRKKDLKEMNIKKKGNFKLNKTKLQLKLCEAYAEVEVSQPLAIIGSHKFLEISLNRGNAAKRFQIKGGDTVTVYREEE